MKNLRREDLSLFQYIKNTALRDYIEKEEQVELELVSAEPGSYVYQAVSTMIPSPFSRGRGWCYFDCPSLDSNGDCIYSVDTTCVPEFIMVSGTDALGNLCVGTPEQDYRITVYDETLNTISGSEYLIDYVDGRIIMDNDLTVPTLIDYSWYYVSVVDQWDYVEAASVPVVVVDMYGTDKTGYQIGAGKKVKRKANIHIFATSQSERDDLIEVLYDSLYNKSAPVYEFTTGDVLAHDGTFFGRAENMNKLTSLFNRITLNDENILHGSMMFTNVSARHISLPLLGPIVKTDITQSELNAYRAVISFDVETYTRS